MASPLVPCHALPTCQHDPAPCLCLPPATPAGLGLDSVLPAVVERIPPPRGNPAGDLKMLLFDAYHDEYR